ncbi:MAG TPA: hypothetical protein VJX67_12895 [Blastocatellia bacterium]|nr:hypothetical protein [Blastocatellia bacterium]
MVVPWMLRARCIPVLLGALLIGSHSQAAAQSKDGSQPAMPGSMTANEQPYTSTYSKTFPEGKTWPESLSKATIVKDPPDASKHYSNTFDPKPEEVRKILARYAVMSQQDWQHIASSPAPDSAVNSPIEDRGGLVILPDGRRLRWLLRSPSLARVIYPDGGTVYLAGGCGCYYKK